VPTLSDQALLCALHQGDRLRDYAVLVREANEFLSGRSKTVKNELAGEMEKASGGLDFERAAILRDRLAALSAIQSHQGVNPRGVEEADVFAFYQQGGFSCVEVFFFRTGQNWGNRAYFPKADRSLAPGKSSRPFSRQFYDDKPAPRLILISHAIEDRALLAEALSTKSGHKIEVTVPQRGEKEGSDRACARQCARSARPQACRDVVAGETPAPARRNVRPAAGAAAHRGFRQQPHSGFERGRCHDRRRAGGLRKSQYRKFNIRSADLLPATISP